MRISLFLFILLSMRFSLTAQKIKPGFDKAEYLELMRVSVRTVADSAYASKFDAPKNFKMAYQSKPIGLDNLWDLWVDAEGRACISVRGTTMKQESWLANFYAAMVPAKGHVVYQKEDTFFYHFADNPFAAVHVGWLLSTAYLATDMLPKIDSLYALGVKDYYIVGHSQGGAIAYLLTSHLSNLKTTGRLNQDMLFKTYCSAAPKPGNLYYAYEYEAMTHGGWAFNVVNALDWVPETPMSIQTLDDFNPTNPFVHAEGVIKKQRIPAKWVLKRVYKKLDKPTRTAQKNYQKYLGDVAANVIRTNIPDYVQPEFYSSNNYVRVGVTIVLLPNEAYRSAFPENANEIFTHHVHAPYMFLAEELKD